MNTPEPLKTRERSPALLWLIWVPWVFFFTPAVVNLFQVHPPLPRLMATLASVALFFLLYLWATWQNAQRRMSGLPATAGDAQSWLVIGAMVILCLVLPFLARETQSDWLDLFILTSAFLGGRLPTVRLIQTIPLLVLLELGGGRLLGFSWADLGQSALYLVVVGIVVHILVRVIITGQELREARGEIARLAVQAERLRLSRDLHDSVKQQLFAMSMQLGVALAQLEHNREAARKPLLEAEALVHQAQQDLTTLIQDLRPSLLQEKGLVAALRDWVTTWSRQNSIPVDLHLPAHCPLLPAVEEALWRVAQEALSNIARHSQASNVQLRLETPPEQVLLSIRDNGRGFEQHGGQPSGVGLRSIQERIAAVGGSVLLESRSGDGTSLVVHCPVPRQSQGERDVPAESEARS